MTDSNNITRVKVFQAGLRRVRIRMSRLRNLEEPIYDPSASTKVVDVFRAAFHLMWKGTKNASGCYQITEELITLLGPNREVAAVTTQRIRALHLYYRDERKHALSTINRKMSCLSKVLRFAYDGRLISSMPIIPFSKEPQGRRRFLSQFEEGLIFSKLKPEHKALAQFLLYTGCRVGEAMKVQWCDISSDRVTLWHTKSGKPRTIPLVTKAKEAIEIVRAMNRPMPFKGRYNAFHIDWANARRQSGLGEDKQVVPHILRHTCASRLVQAGVDVVRVKEWLGHSSLHLTMNYAHLAPGDLFAIAAVLET